MNPDSSGLKVNYSFVTGSTGSIPEGSVDTTVQEKNITYPTDDKLYKKVIKNVGL
jgi:hypothetical protein